MEFYLCKEINKMTDSEFQKANKWFEDNFKLIRNDEMYTYNDMLEIGRIMKGKGYDKLIIEPYNVLYKNTTNEHQYDYNAMLDIRIFIKQTGMGVLMNVHAVTEALRRLYPKDHDYAGYAMPPNKADTEGGGKFANKADNFLVVHRMADHPDRWMWTEIHVQKIKEIETGGCRTFKDQPILIKLTPNATGFEDQSGYNPILNYWNRNKPVQQVIQPIPEKPKDDFIPLRERREKTFIDKNDDNDEVPF
jgi:hypothetical protein